MFLLRLICLLLISSVFTAKALDQISFFIEQAEFSGTKVEGLDFRFEYSTDQIPQLFIYINKLKLDSGQKFQRVEITCPLPSTQVFLQFDLIDCPQGQFAAKSAQLGRLESKIKIFFDRKNEYVEIKLSRLNIASGRIYLYAKVDHGSWSVKLQGRSLDVAKVKKLADRFIDIKDISSDESGKFDLAINAFGRDAELTSAKVILNTSKLNFYSSSVAEDLDAKLDLYLQKKSKQWQVEGQLDLLAGAFYLELQAEEDAVAPGFLLEPQQEPISLSFDMNWQDQRIRFDQLTLNHSQVMTAKVSGTVHPKQDPVVDKLTVSINTEDLGALFPVYLQPFLLDSGVTEIELVGQAALNIKLDQGSISDFYLNMRDIYAEDQEGRFHIAGLEGEVLLNSDPNKKDSEIKWRGGSIYKMDIGASGMKLSSQGRSMRLREKVSIPIFDGTLQIDNLEMKKMGLADYSVSIDSQLTPITIGEITEVLDWPIMAGSIAGEIPGAYFQHGDLAIKGALHVKVFDGDINISGLRLDDLFGLVPTLYADMEIENLDLGLLTQTFEFGAISGKLDGYIRDVQLDNWQPVKFDASFSTPKKDRSKRRISQRAIDNITSIGGGGAGSSVISRGILGMFKDFPYSKIGLSCRLVESTCFMDGVEDSDNGYYIVKHGLLPPWLNIKGFNRKVNWQDLLNRLKNISKTDGPVIE